MNRFIHTATKSGTAAVLIGSYVLTSAAFAAPPGVTISGTTPDLQGKADYYARVAADYRARMRTDEKRAIIYFTLANRWDQKAQRYHLAALQAAGEPLYRR
jgi:hypothetical protein